MYESLIGKLATQAELEDKVFTDWCKKLCITPRKHRKLWEYRYILEAWKAWDNLQVRGYGQSGIGFGVGTEPLTSYFASQGMLVLASDLSEEEAKGIGWIESNQHADALTDLFMPGVVSADLFDCNVDFKSINMNEIPEDLKEGDFDFLWSSCSLEHIGSRKHGFDFVKESLRCIRPGGIAIHTTEYNVSSTTRTIDNPNLCVYTGPDVQALVEEVRAMGHWIEIDYSLGEGELDRYYDLPPYKQDPHIKLVLGTTVVTSIGFCIVKDGLR